MSDTQDQHDELRGRLVDQVLREILAGDTPPDLTDSIVAASRQNDLQPAQVEPLSRRRSRRRTWWIVLSTAASVAVIVALAKAPEYLRQRNSVAAVQTLDTIDLAAPAVAVPSSSEHSTEALFGVAIKDDPQGPAEQFVRKDFSDKSVSVDNLSQGVQPESPAALATEQGWQMTVEPSMQIPSPRLPELVAGDVQANSQTSTFVATPYSGMKNGRRLEGAFGGQRNSNQAGTKRSEQDFKAPVPQSEQSGPEIVGAVRGYREQLERGKTVTGDTEPQSSSAMRFGGLGGGGYGDNGGYGPPASDSSGSESSGYGGGGYGGYGGGGYGRGGYGGGGYGGYGGGGARGAYRPLASDSSGSASSDGYGGAAGYRPAGAESATPVFEALNTAGKSVESSATPFPDDPPITYPDAQEWGALSERRAARYSQFDLASKPGTGEQSDGISAASRPSLGTSKLQPSTTTKLSSQPSLGVARGTNTAVAPVQLGDAGFARARAANDLPVEQRLNRQSVIRGEIKQLADELRTASEKLASPLADDATISSLDVKLSKISRLRQEYVRLEAERNQVGQGQGPGNSGDQYQRIYENPFVVAQGTDAVSTFSIDVDTASYTNVRQFLLGHGQLPPPDAVRIEELVNYFDYAYQPPVDEKPFAASIEVAGCPWQPKHRLVRVGIKGREIDNDQRPPSNLVFLVDVSGSMKQSNKLPLVIEGLKQLTSELTENDRVAIVVYASVEGLALPSTPGSERETILATLGQLTAGGSTAGGAGIQLAYKIAQEHFITHGANRVILCTDGDFNVGVTDTADLQRMAEEKARGGIFLTVLGFGRGNLNDAMMETISNKGNGNYYYVDNALEARKVLVKQMAGTLVTIAKDVKIQIEFNPAKVAGYRLLGYENRILAKEDFNDDTKDAGEIGAGHTVTALYEVIPAGQNVDVVHADDLKYQQAARWNDDVTSDELLTLKLRYKEPDEDTSTPSEFAIHDEDTSFALASEDFKFAAAVAGFGLLLRDSKYKGNVTIDAVLEIATEGAGRDEYGYRKGFLNMVVRAKELGL